MGVIDLLLQQNTRRRRRLYIIHYAYNYTILALIDKEKAAAVVCGLAQVLLTHILLLLFFV